VTSRERYRFLEERCPPATQLWLLMPFMTFPRRKQCRGKAETGSVAAVSPQAPSLPSAPSAPSETALILPHRGPQLPFRPCRRMSVLVEGAHSSPNSPPVPNSPTLFRRGGPPGLPGYASRDGTTPDPRRWGQSAGKPDLHAPRCLRSPNAQACGQHCKMPACAPYPRRARHIRTRRPFPTGSRPQKSASSPSSSHSGSRVTEDHLD
jgi:hypothetical protein